jgi:hypothetical protein
MRRLLVFAVALVAFVGMLAPPVMAQAPAPKVTITGFIDTLGTYTQNMSQYDNDYSRKGDTQAYGRNRGRYDIIGEIGKAKAVLGLELDFYFGQTGTSNSNFQPGSSPTSAGFGSDGAFNLNNDVRGIIEIKWLYTEFPLPIPLDNTFTVGGMPFGSLATDKLATYANGDFGGAAWSLRFTPAAQLNLTYVQVEESLTGGRDGFFRGEDWAGIISFGFSPFKGLDIKPMYSYFQAKGSTGGPARQGRGGVDTTTAYTAGANTFSLGGVAFANQNSYSGPVENRHTIGVDGRFTAGPFTLQPTVLYQFGHRENIVATPSGCPASLCNMTPYGALGQHFRADISAWLVDIRAGFNVGPLSLGLLGIFSTGQDAKSNPFKSVRYYQPLDTDSSYAGDWGTQILSLGIDYFHQLYYNVPGLSLGQAIGYDKYGRMQLGGKVSYALTPTFTVGAGASAAWTQYKVDTDSTLVPSAGLVPNFTQNGGRAQGDSRYIGTEIDLASTWRFAPGIAFDLAGAYLFAGDALGHTTTVGCCNGVNGGIYGTGVRGGGVNDVLLATARVRFSF